MVAVAMGAVMGVGDAVELGADLFPPDSTPSTMRPPTISAATWIPFSPLLFFAGCVCHTSSQLLTVQDSFVIAGRS